MSARARARGFSLLEVVIALAILAVSLMMILAANASSLEATARTRDISVATLLARSKMIDLELMLNDEGFPEGERKESGDFKDDGHGDIKWEATITEVEITLDGMMDLCEGFAAEAELDTGFGAGTGCAGMLDSIGMMANPLLEELSNSLRLVELKVTWPVGGGYTESIDLRTLVAREDFAMQEARDRELESTPAGVNPNQTQPGMAPGVPGGALMPGLGGGR